jgi:hypothetical protein
VLAAYAVLPAKVGVTDAARLLIQNQSRARRVEPLLKPDADCELSWKLTV